MKKILRLSAISFVLLGLVAFRSFLSIDSVIVALRTGNATELGKYMDENVDLSMPDRSDNYSRAQAVLVLKDFFSRNGVSGFEVKHKGANGGNQFCIGQLSTKAGEYRTTVFMKAEGGRHVINEIKFTP